MPVLLLATLVTLTAQQVLTPVLAPLSRRLGLEAWQLGFAAALRGEWRRTASGGGRDCRALLGVRGQPPGVRAVTSRD
jgi:hypothetical protein